MRKLIDLMKNVAEELKATVKDGAGRFPSFKKLVDHMASVTQSIETAEPYDSLE